MHMLTCFVCVLVIWQFNFLRCFDYGAPQSAWLCPSFPFSLYCTRCKPRMTLCSKQKSGNPRTHKLRFGSQSKAKQTVRVTFLATFPRPWCLVFSVMHVVRLAVGCTIDCLHWLATHAATSGTCHTHSCIFKPSCLCTKASLRDQRSGVDWRSSQY